MFATATKNFVEEVDKDGVLIPVSSLNDSIKILSLVIKRRRYWFWQKPKYLATDFCFNDILKGDQPILPVLTETDFIKYNGRFSDNMQGNIEANLHPEALNLSVEGKDSSKLRSAFGSLKKEELDLQKLLRDSKDRVLDMSHSLIQQTKEKRREVFGVVKERIVTTQPSSVIEEVQQTGALGGLLSLCGPKALKVSFKENANLAKDSNVTMELPPHTTIAYGLSELEVKPNGHYELCLMSGTHGGFEVDGSSEEQLVGAIDGHKNTANSNWLKQELDKLGSHFQLLSGLKASTRSSLFQYVCSVLKERGAVSLLESVLNQIRHGERPPLDSGQADSQTQTVQALLEVLVLSGEEKSVETEDFSCTLLALHLVISALDEMSDDCRAVLGSCCTPQVLKSLDLLVQCVTEAGEMSLSSGDLAPLTGDTYQRTELLFASCGVSLKRDGELLRTEVICQQTDPTLILCIVVKGLAAISHSVQCHL
ncbi:gasdermin Eb [Gadus morhua]|uniref:Gasdermin Eb n=1 Tax=Gadus morhua TaxID=8049 RepID=A0A8C4Z841_GADMO|nr:gasdermin-E-like [Gadus morhua]